MVKNLLLGLVVGLLTVISMVVMLNFVLQTTISTSTGLFSNLNAVVVILIYGVGIAIIGTSADKLFGKKK